ncbi:hypothetical protein ANRL1_04454 [Anaerolineae bacterium]|nr:hypothetical protein ANRL1_04454 [Anaerolineae bacterium]
MLYVKSSSIKLWRWLGSIVIVALLLSGLPGGVQPAQAAPTELFFSEYIEGSSNNKALEIYNGTGASINLATAGYSVQMYFNGSSSAGLTINLTGTVANGDVYVLAHSSANATILAQADQTNGSGWFNGDDAVVLRKGTTSIDVIGQIGFDPGTEWGTGLTSTADNTLRRKSTIQAGDPNGGDAFDPAIEWDGFATDTFDGLGSHFLFDAPPGVSSTVPANGATNIALNANITVNFSEAVNVSGAWFTISCSSSGAHTATVTGGPSTFTLNPNTDFVPGENCTLTIVATQVGDQDTSDPPDNMVANYTATLSTIGVCQAPFTPIYSIQGNGMTAAITGNVTTQGVVVGDFEGSTSVGIQGFYIQDATGDANPLTSDGIFVYTGNANVVSAGQLVRVTGYARERFDQTTLNGSNSDSSAVPAANIVNCGTGSVPPVDVNFPVAQATDLERFEGMLVRLPQALVIAEYFNYDRFGEIVLALPINGESRPFTPTSIVDPGAPSIARAIANSLRRITLDDGLGSQNPAALRHPNGGAFGLNNRFRGGDTVQNTVGVLGYDFGLYRIQPTGPATYTAANPRPTAPGSVNGASLRVAAMNTLNFFLTQDYPTGNPLDNKCGPSQNVECRGADSDQSQEFTRQRNKLLAALVGLNADIIGLNELENTAGVDPLGDLTNGIVAGLNATLGAGTYAHINTGVIGTDAIRVGMIYKPSKVNPVGAFKLLTTTVDPRFRDTKNRPVLAQTFQVISTGARFTVVVNHLKSKGSDCNDVGDPDTGDGQGNCNVTRKLAAQALMDWLATDPTGSGDPDFLIMGDLNSYAKEDPIKAVRAGADDTLGTGDDFTNLIAKYQGTYAYSYVFDGQSGYLDHALASPSLVAQAKGAVDWHINADEPDLLDYDTSFKPPSQDALYEPNAYRSSDHDAVVVGLDLDGTPPTVSVSPNTLWPANHKYVTVKLTVTDNTDPNPSVQILSVTSNEPDNGLGDGDTPNDIVIVNNTTIQLRAERSGTGTGRVYTITYKAADAYGNSKTASVTVTVPQSQGK